MLSRWYRRAHFRLALSYRVRLQRFSWLHDIMLDMSQLGGQPQGYKVLRNTSLVGWIIPWEGGIEEAIKRAVIDVADVANLNLTKLRRLRMPEGMSVPKMDELASKNLGYLQRLDHD